MSELRAEALEDPLAYDVDDFHEPWVPRAPVVMLHGFARNADFWRGWVPALGRERAVIRPDLRGCGRNLVVPASYTTDGLVTDLVALLDALEVECAHLVGESSGGLIAANAAVAAPDRVASLTLVSTPVLPAGHDKAVKSAGFDSTEEALEGLGLAGWWLESRRLGGELTGDDARDRYYAKQLALTSVPAALGMWDWIHSPEHDLLEIAEKIGQPVLLMAPGSSHGTNLDQQRALAAALPAGRLTEYPDFNHEMYYLHAGALAGDCARFLRQTAA